MPPPEALTEPPCARTCARASNRVAPAIPFSAGPVPRMIRVLPFSTETSARCGVSNAMFTLTRFAGCAVASRSTITWSTADANAVRITCVAPTSKRVCAVAVGRWSSRR